MRHFVLLILSFILTSTPLFSQQFSAENVINPSCGWAQGRIDLELFDIDGDGDKDIVYPSGTHAKVIWHENTGNNSFGAEKTLLNTPYPTTIRFADFDQDGDLDFALTKKDNQHGISLAWYEKTIDTSFIQHALNYSFSYIGDAVMETGDIDNDGDIDIVFAEQLTTKLSLFRNNGNGVFVDVVIDSTFQNPVDLKLGDLNNDGKLDIVANQKDPLNKTFWFQNFGNAGFSSPIILANKGDRFNLKDLNNDTMLDVVLVGPSSGILSWLKNNNNAQSFTEKTIIPGGYYSSGNCAAEDLNGDGLIDVLYGNGWSSYRNISFYANTGNESFQFKQYINNIPLADFGTLQDFVLDDIDGDGDKDIFYASLGDSGMIGWCENFLFNPLRVNGKLFHDKNQNGQMDSLETLFAYAKVYAGNHFSYSNEDGSYFLALAQGNYTVKSDSISGWHITNNPPTYNVSLSISDPVKSNINFGYYPDTLETNINGDIIGSEPRCDNDSYIWLTFKNSGTTRPNLLYECILHDSIILNTVSSVPDSIINNKIYLHSDTLDYFHSNTYKLSVRMPDFNHMGDTLISISNIYEIQSDSSLQLIGSDTLSQILLCSYDPNDITVFPIGKGVNGEIRKNQTLDYTIRFQNTGNASAINIVVKDSLDSNLDLSSFQLIASSHNVKVVSQDNGLINFIFDGINLASMGFDEPQSHGFVKYSIKPILAIDPNTKINNDAYIYFDNNPAIHTNIVTNTIECYSIPTPVITPASDLLTTGLGNEYSFEWYKNDTLLLNSNNASYQPNTDGYYTVKITDQYGCIRTSSPYLFQLTNLKNSLKQAVNIYPNPFSEEFTINFSEQISENYDLLLIDILGREEIRLSAFNRKVIKLEGSKLSDGLKFIILENKSNNVRAFIATVEKN